MESRKLKAAQLIGIKQGREVTPLALPSGHTYIYRIYGPIEDPEHYIDLIDTLDTALPQDTITLYLNSPGGDLNGAISIIHAIMRTKAKVVSIADGEVASAATLLLFAAEEIWVSTYSYFMAHDASHGLRGKVSETLKGVTATSSLVKKIYTDLYSPFMSEQEIQDIIDGKDMYLSSEELYDRVCSAVDKYNEETKPAE